MTPQAPYRPLRRNDIVWHEASLSWFIPARVVRRLDDVRVRIVNTLGRVVDIADAELTLAHPAEVRRYDGDSSAARRARPVVRQLPSLRRLKQNAAWYTPTVWRRPKRAA